MIMCQNESKLQYTKNIYSDLKHCYTNNKQTLIGVPWLYVYSYKINLSFGIHLYIQSILYQQVLNFCRKACSLEQYWIWCHWSYSIWEGGFSNIFNFKFKILFLSSVFSLSGVWALFEGIIFRFSLKDFFSRVILISICPIGRLFFNGFSSDVFLKCVCVCMGRTGRGGKPREEGRDQGIARGWWTRDNLIWEIWINTG